MTAEPDSVSRPLVMAEFPGQPTPILPSPLLITRVAQAAASALQRPLVAVLFLFAAVFVAYLPALDAQFIWDDHILVRDNGLIRSPLLILESFRHTLFEGESNFYRPTQTIVFILDYWLGGSQPFIFHFSSILIHALNGIVLFFLLRQLLPSMLPAGLSLEGSVGERNHKFELIAWMLALVWALYPIHSATVDYVSGSADSLAMLFSVLAWLAAGRCLRADGSTGRVAWGGVAGLCLLAGFCSKEIAFVWLVLFGLHLLVFSRGDSVSLSRRLGLLCGGLLMYGAYALLRHIPTMPVMPVSNRKISHIIMALRALGDYGSLLVFPGKLLMERQVYPPPNALLTTEDQWFYSSLTVGGVLLLAIFAAGVLWRGSGQRLRCFGVCWFMCGFLPVSNLFMTINATVAEHWLYLPSIGFLLFAMGCAWQIPTHRLRVAVLVCTLMASAAFGMRTYWRAFDWANEFSFYSQTVADGGDVPRARLGYANAYSRRNDDETAIKLLRQVVVDDPSDLAAQTNLANALARQGRYEEAKPVMERVFLRAANASPRIFLVMLSKMDLLEKDDAHWPALHAAALAKQMQQHPDSWELVQYDALTQLREGLTASALHEVSGYAQAHWWHYPSWYMLGSIYTNEGQPVQALAAFKQASRLDVYDAEALSAAAQICASEGQLAEAARLQRVAVDRQPESPRQHALFSKILESASQPAESARQLAIATTLLSKTVPVTP